MTGSTTTSSRTRQFLILLGSRGLTLIIGLVSSFVFVTHMSQDTYGAYRYATNLLNALAVFAVLGIPFTASRVLLHRPDAASMRPVYGFAVRLVAGISLALSAVVGLAVLALERLGVITVVAGLVVAIPLLYTITLQSTFITMLQGSNRIHDIALQTLLPAVGLLAGVVVLGRIVAELSIGHVLALFGVVYTLVHLFTVIRLRIPVLDRPPADLVAEMRTEFRANGRYIYFGSLVGVASSHLVNMVLGGVAGMAEYALLGLALALSAPVQFIPAVLGTVQFRSNATSRRLGRRNLLGTVALTLAAVCGYLVFIRLLLPLYPQSYLGALDFTTVLSCHAAAIGLGDYFNRFITAHGHGRLINLSAIASGVTNVAFSLIGLAGWGLAGAVWGRAAAGLVYLGYMVLAYRSVVEGMGDVPER